MIVCYINNLNININSFIFIHSDEFNYAFNRIFDISNVKVYIPKYLLLNKQSLLIYVIQ